MGECLTRTGPELRQKGEAPLEEHRKKKSQWKRREERREKEESGERSRNCQGKGRRGRGSKEKEG